MNLDINRVSSSVSSNQPNQANDLKNNSQITFEIIGQDLNTEKKFLENLNLDDSNHLTQEELKSTVFNAYKTIENLQTDLM